MLFQLLSKELDQSPNLNWKDSKKLTSTDHSDKNGTIKEMKAEDLKKKEKLLKRTDSFCLFKFIHYFFNICLNLHKKFKIEFIYFFCNRLKVLLIKDKSFVGILLE